MALDRFVYWHGAERPTHEQVRQTCEDFMGGVGTVEWSNECGRIIITLPGKCTDPRRRSYPEYARPFADDDERWIEVFEDIESIDVITRQADDFTNALATRLADVFARTWNGRSGA